MDKDFSTMLDYIAQHDWSAMITLILAMAAVSMYMLSKILTNTKMVRDAYFALKDAPPHSYQKQFSIENSVSEMLDYIRHEVNADRVLLCRIHNGVTDIANNPLLKISCVNESLHVGIPPRSKSMQNIPISFCASLLDELVRGRCIALPELDSDYGREKLNEFTLDLIKRSGTRSAYLFPLEDSYGSIFGVISVNFSRNDKHLDESELDWIKNRCHGIGSLISLTKSGAVDDRDSNDRF